MEKLVIHNYDQDPVINYHLNDRALNRNKIGISIIDLWRSTNSSSLNVSDNEIIFRTVIFHPNTKKILFHQTNSIDFAVVLEGEIDLIVSNSKISLKAGDLVVQNRNEHAWVNKSLNPCRILFTMTSLNRNCAIP